jgi:hypothetical protein
VPAQPEWLLHVPAIGRVLEALDFPVLDRAMVEQLFRLRRRARFTSSSPAPQICWPSFTV